MEHIFVEVFVPLPLCARLFSAENSFVNGVGIIRAVHVQKQRGAVTAHRRAGALQARIVAASLRSLREQAL